MEPLSRETRVLDTFEPGLWMNQSDVLKLARMDASTCLSTLRRLVDRGVLEFGLVGRKGINGRRRHIYRLAMRNREAA